MKLWVEIYTKRKYTRYGIPEIVRIVYNPYNKSIKEVIHFWILPEYWNQVYGIKT